MNPMEKNKNLMVFVENDRCITDAIQAVTGCSLGHRTLKLRPYGKSAATFIDMKTEKAVRISVVEKKIPEKTGPEAGKDMIGTLRDSPDSDLFRVKRVQVAIPEWELPGPPNHRTKCTMCSEMILDNKEVVRDGIVLCGNCANGSYYKERD
jgi:formylmethanofuran dehydrogenase subunit E